MPTETRRQRLTAAQRRSRILDAATQVFAERGYERASMAAIARAAGVVPSVIYDHFASKRELHIELLERHGQALIERAARALDVDSWEELFTLNVEAFYEVVEEDRFVWRMLFRDPPADPDIAAAHRGIQDRATAAIAGLLAMVEPDAELLPGVERACANVIIAESIKSAINGLAGWWYEHRDVPREQIVTAARTLLWTGLEQLVEGLAARS